MDDLIVVAGGVSKAYETGPVKVDALRGVDLEVKRGEMVSIMGPSGCGKTTLLNTLSGLDDIDSGQVLIDGVVLHDLPDDERTDYRARRMGFIFQLYNLLPVLSAVENVEMPLLVSGTNASEARRKAIGMLDRVGLADRANHIPAKLSGGQRQRVALARALFGDPAFLVLDEPNSSLDNDGEEALFGALKELKKAGRTLVMIAHRPRALDHVDKILVLRGGRVELFGPRDAVLEKLTGEQTVPARQVAASSSGQNGGVVDGKGQPA